MTDLRKFRTLAKNWEAFGDTDPLFGVLSDPTKFGGKWDAGEFFASGHAHVQKLLRTLTDARASFEPGSCLDFGCGVGRLSVPLSESFSRTVGVDVARPMIEAARRYAPPGARCEFVVNRDPDLRRFQSATFDVVHSCLVLQHIPPEISIGYIAEFFRVCKPGGLVVFQVPAATRTEAEISASHALPASAFAAEIALADPPDTLAAAAAVTLTCRVTNRGGVTWRHDIPAGRHLCLGNHWMLPDGTRVVSDDGRAFLPHPVDPGATVEIPLTVQAPAAPGRYVLELDLVQEHVSWFAERGSPTARVPVTVTGVRPAATDAPAVVEASGAFETPPAVRRRPFFERLRLRLRRGSPTFEMYVVPRAAVEATIRSSGATLLRAVDDNAAGPGWLSYTYVCRRKETEIFREKKEERREEVEEERGERGQDHDCG